MTTGVEARERSFVERCEQEFALAGRIQAGLSAKEHIHSSNGALSPEERTILEGQMRDGVEARDTLVMAHQGLVGQAIKRYCQGIETPHPDLFNDGIIWLIDAAGRFDPRLGTFSTFATRILSQDFRHKAWENDGLIRIPRTASETIHRSNQVAEQLAQELGRDPTTKEVAQRASTNFSITPSRWVTMTPGDFIFF